jgi:hypothetical protein
MTKEDYTEQNQSINYFLDLVVRNLDKVVENEEVNVTGLKSQISMVRSAMFTWGQMLGEVAYLTYTSPEAKDDHFTQAIGSLAEIQAFMMGVVESMDNLDYGLKRVEANING